MDILTPNHSSIFSSIKLYVGEKDIPCPTASKVIH
jgi:hypothetical protein